MDKAHHVSGSAVLPLPRVPILLLTMLALAACGTPAQVSDPSEAARPVPIIDYQSGLTRYQPFGDPEPLSWRDANDRVGAKSAGAADAPAAQPPDARPRGDGARPPGPAPHQQKH